MGVAVPGGAGQPHLLPQIVGADLLGAVLRRRFSASRVAASPVEYRHAQRDTHSAGGQGIIYSGADGAIISEGLDGGQAFELDLVRGKARSGFALLLRA